MHVKHSKTFALIGAAGYVAPRHLAAIRDNGGVLVGAIDLADSVGILDSYFPHADFFTEFERFERFLFKKSKMGSPVDFVSICSPNYMHDTHCRFALHLGADAICEKPLVLAIHNLDRLVDAERDTGHKINCILQLRLHPEVKRLKELVSASSDQCFQVNLDYITSRGKWYDVSWKGDNEKSGGILFNIGIHFFDMLLYVFGKPKMFQINSYEHYSAGGTIKFNNANVSWFLSTNANDLPKNHKTSTFRSLKLDGQEFEFSSGFFDLHALSYEAIINGQGFGLDDVRPSIDLVAELRKSGEGL